MSASSAPVAKRNIMGLLAADGALVDVQIEYAWPNTPGQECIAFGKTTLEEVSPTYGNGRKREAYDLELIVEVAQDGDDAQTGEERCWAIVARIEAILSPIETRGRLTFSAADGVNLWATIAGIEMIPYPLGDQRIAQAVVTIQCHNDK